jgi:hypothetical protein
LAVQPTSAAQRKCIPQEAHNTAHCTMSFSSASLTAPAAHLCRFHFGQSIRPSVLSVKSLMFAPWKRPKLLAQSLSAAGAWTPCLHLQ